MDAGIDLYEEGEDLSVFINTNFILPIAGFIGLILPLVKSIRTLLSQSFTKEFLTYVKLPSYAKHIGQISEMRQDIRLMCDIRLKFEEMDQSSWLGEWRSPGPRKRLLFVVDDLDRCGPEGIVKTFEAIRLVMDIPQVVVIIAIDQRIALAALAKHYEKLEKHHQLDDARSIARDYLGKMIQLPIVLQEPDIHASTGYMAHLWGDTESSQHHWKNDVFAKVKTVQSVSSTDEYTDERADLITDVSLNGIDIPTKQEMMAYVNQMDLGRLQEEKVIIGLSRSQKAAFVYWADYLGLANPRQLKRLNNSYNLLRLVSKRQDVLLTSEEHYLPYGLLVSLLALEYVNSEEEESIREICRDYLYGRNAGNQLEAKEKGILDKAIAVINLKVTHEKEMAKNGDANNETFLLSRKQLLDFVALFVLPAIEIKCQSG